MLQIRIAFLDMAKEIVELEMAEMIDVHSLGRKVPNDHGRYHLFRFPHSHEGIDSILHQSSNKK